MDRSAGANRTSVLPPPEPTMLGIARSLRHSEATRAKHLFYYEFLDPRPCGERMADGDEHSIKVLSYHLNLLAGCQLGKAVCVWKSALTHLTARAASQATRLPRHPV